MCNNSNHLKEKFSLIRENIIQWSATTLKKNVKCLVVGEQIKFYNFINKLVKGKLNWVTLRV